MEKWPAGGSASNTGVDPMDLRPWPDPGLSPQQQAQQRLLWEQWTEFRIQQVNSFVENLSQTLRRHRPDLILSAAVFAKPEHERLQKNSARLGHLGP